MPVRSIDDQLSRLDALRRAAPSPQTRAELEKALSGKSNLLAAKAARVAGELKLKEIQPAMAAAFRHFLEDGSDKGCLAKTAIVKALDALEARDEETFLLGAKHVQMEPSFGGSGDVAVELRCESVAALVRMNSRKMWEPLADLLADPDSQARATAARALGATGQDAAKLLLRYKLK